MVIHFFCLDHVVRAVQVPLATQGVPGGTDKPRKARALIRSRFLGLFKRPESDVLTGPAVRAGPAAKLSKIVSLSRRAPKNAQASATAWRAVSPSMVGAGPARFWHKTLFSSLSPFDQQYIR